MEPSDIPFRDLDELEGATLAGRFVLEQEIGRGGYGAVFVGEQISVGRKCAIKVLVPHVLEKEANIKRFKREAKMTSALAHPNTVVIYDFGVDEERRLLYLAMEYIKGESLRARIHRRRQLDLETTVWIAHQAASSLQDAHEAGMVHRDVKPHNIMLTQRGGDIDFVKVIDFGIAKFLDDDSIRETFQRVTQTGMVIGTPAYMPPEQVRSQELDGRADQYALAACVYQMLTGNRLFSGDSAIDVATKQLTQRPVPVSEINPDVGPGVERVLMRALAKEREQRFDTITEFTRALADAADVALRAVDSTERDRVVAEAATLPLGPVKPTTESTTEPFGAQAPTRSAEVKSIVSTEPDEEQPSSAGLLLLVGLITVCIVLVGIAFGSEDEPMPRRETAEPTVVAAVETAPPDVGGTAGVLVDVGTTVEDVGEPVTAPVEPAVVEADPVVPPTKPKTEPPATGRISITVVPWGTIVIDGEERSTRRHATFELSAGKHAIELRQDGDRVARKTVDVKPGKNRMVKLIAAP